jgi:hypothetical protein
MQTELETKEKVKIVPCEVWNSIPGSEYYEASNLGRVRVLTHYEKINTKKRKYIRIRKGKILKQSFRGEYLACSIKNKPQSVHRMVALAFYKIPLKNFVVNHKNGIKKDNRLENLEWVTSSQNEKHSYKILGKQPWNKGKHYDTTKAVLIRKANYNKKCLTTFQEYKSSGLTQEKLALKYNLSRRQIGERIKRAKEVLYE